MQPSALSNPSSHPASNVSCKLSPASSTAPTHSQPEPLEASPAVADSMGALRYTAYLYDVKSEDANHFDRPHCHTNLAHIHTTGDRNYYLLNEEHFGEVILGGGSGADIYTVNQPAKAGFRDAERTIIRKLMPLPAGKKQNTEAKEEARVSLFHAHSEGSLGDLYNRDAKSWFAAQILEQKREEVSELVSDTRAQILSRGVIYRHSVIPGMRSQGTAVFHDATLLQGVEFAKAITNDNRILIDDELDDLANLQIDLLNRYDFHQRNIYWARCSDVEEPYRVGTDFFYAPTAEQLFEPLRRGKHNQLHIDGYPLHQLLLQSHIVVDGLRYSNPLHNGQIIDQFKRYKVAEQTIQVHGDLQQTNLMLIEEPADNNGESQRRLKGIDHRTMEALTPGYAETAKMLWGPSFIPGMEDMWNAQLSPSRDGSATLAITLSPKPEHRHSIENFQRFDQRLKSNAKMNEAINTVCREDNDARAVIALAKSNQFLRDIRILLPRLESSTNLTESEYLNRRILFDFGQAAKLYDAYLTQFGARPKFLY